MKQKERNELLNQGKRVFRARHIDTNTFWEGIAENPGIAIKKAAEETGCIGAFELRESTGSGWKKVKAEMDEKNFDILASGAGVAAVKKLVGKMGEQNLSITHRQIELIQKIVEEGWAAAYQLGREDKI